MAESLCNIAIKSYGCPKCGAKPEEYCKFPSGGKKWPPHKERMHQLNKNDMQKGVIPGYKAILF